MRPLFFFLLFGSDISFETPFVEDLLGYCDEIPTFLLVQVVPLTLGSFFRLSILLYLFRQGAPESRGHSSSESFFFEFLKELREHRRDGTVR